MVKNNISIKFLIHLVGERPALWDKTSDDYRDRQLKETSWREICAFVNEDFHNLPPKEKNEFYKMIMKKWTHIRDSWVKSMKYGYDEVTKLPPKPYVYHNDLNFMQKILKCKPHRFDLNKCQPSNAHFEEFFRETNETQNSFGTSHDAEDNEAEEGEVNEPEIDFKQEPNTSKIESKVKVAIEAEESDEWHLEETEIVPETTDQEKTEQLKKKRTSIFINSRTNGEENVERKVSPELKFEPAIKVAEVSSYKRTPVHTKLPKVESVTSYRQKVRYNNIESRHWNFFKGILPSIGGLDEDHVLQFQSGVICLLQKLRDSQRKTKKSNRLSSHSIFKGRGRKRKASLDDDDDDDDDWATRNNYRGRKSERLTCDPIAPEYRNTDSEYSSDD